MAMESKPEKVVKNLVETVKMVENLIETVETELKPEELETKNLDSTNDDVISEVRAVPSIEPRLVDTVNGQRSVVGIVQALRPLRNALGQSNIGAPVSFQ